MDNLIRLPFEAIESEVSRLLIQMDDPKDWMEYCFYKYWLQQYLAACGWSIKEFEIEFLCKVDQAWPTINN